MSRIKGKEKGDGKHVHGISYEPAICFLNSVLYLNTLSKLTRRAQEAKHENASTIAVAMQEQEKLVLDILWQAFSQNDAEFFHQIAKRLEVGKLGTVVDPIANEIIGIWEVVTQTGLWSEMLRRFPRLKDCAPRNHIPFPELKKKLREAFPRKVFNDEATRRKAKSLGVKFAPPGRPKKSPQF